MTREYILSDIQRKSSPRDLKWIWDITWVDLSTLTVYITVVDESMRNYTRSGWARMVHGDIPYGAYTGLIRTRRRDRTGLGVISADSRPQLMSPLTVSQVTDLIEHQQQQLARLEATPYQTLFA